ncbi:hypothetical protein MKW92_015188 [Papaver armeniacum]|nr:hypothetical protein MKW92_015188 [Papaver armeniacum]
MAASGLRKTLKRKHHDDDFSSDSHSFGSDSDGEACNQRRRHHKKNHNLTKVASLEPNQTPLRIGQEDSAHDYPLLPRSDEVPGKSSTDGTTASVTIKSGNLSLGALEKAKRALQMQKQLSEKLKKIPLVKKVSMPSSDSTLPLGLHNKLHKAPASSVAPSTAALVTPQPGNATVSIVGMGPLSGLATVSIAEKMPGEVAIRQKPPKAPVLRLDAHGREVDEHGNVINQPKMTNLSTLKVNINKQKKDAFQILKPELEVDLESNPHYDARMGINKAKLLRPKRLDFQFVEEGVWSEQAEINKFKSQFGEARAKELKIKQALLAKARAGPDINPNLIEISERVIIEEKPKDPIPEVEWWDVVLLPSGTYGDICSDSIKNDKLETEKITIYVEHPLPIEPPAEPAPPPPQSFKLTKKEQKKLHTQKRLAKEKDRQEMIRQGLLEPPKSKVKMSNLMKVLGSEATQDPTRLEMKIRSEAAERVQAHIDRNIARKLTPAERREKKVKKVFDDPNKLEKIVSVYKISDLSHPQNQYKVNVNAQQNQLTGCLVITEDITVVVVEGGSKSIKRYGKLMRKRIKWAETVRNEEEDSTAEDDDKPVNKCVLVWQGSVAKSSFDGFAVHKCRTEAAARKCFADAGVGHYWDLSVNFKNAMILDQGE